jgi:hypothetical protein
MQVQKRTGAPAKQGRRVKTAPTCGTYSYNSTVLERRREREKNYLVTIAARFYPIMAQGIERGHRSRTEIARHRFAVVAFEGFVDKTRFRASCVKYTKVRGRIYGEHTEIAS